MPRTVPDRRRPEERFIARRIEFELKRRRWSYLELAKRMKDVGCRIDQSAVNKILKGHPPRRIAANELAAFAEVFGVPVGRLMKPLEVDLSQEMNALLEELHERRKTLLEASAAVADIVRKIALLLLGTDQFEPRILNALAEQEKAMINMLDVLLEAEAALRGDEPADYPDIIDSWD